MILEGVRVNLGDRIEASCTSGNFSDSGCNSVAPNWLKKRFSVALLTTLVFFQGMDSGFAGGEDEIYNVYDQPWRSGKDMAQNIYRPSKNVDKDMYGDDLEARIKSTNRYLCSCEHFNLFINEPGSGVSIEIANLANDTNGL